MKRDIPFVANSVISINIYVYTEIPARQNQYVNTNVEQVDVYVGEKHKKKS